MTSVITTPDEVTKTASEVRLVSINFTNVLDSGELLTGTPSVVATPAGLTFDNEVVNTAILTILGSTVAIGKAVQFKVSAGAAGTTYTVSVTIGTDATPAQTIIRKFDLEVVAD